MRLYRKSQCWRFIVRELHWTSHPDSQHTSAVLRSNLPLEFCVEAECQTEISALLFWRENWLAFLLRFIRLLNVSGYAFSASLRSITWITIHKPFVHRLAMWSKYKHKGGDVMRSQSLLICMMLSNIPKFLIIQSNPVFLWGLERVRGAQHCFIFTLYTNNMECTLM